MVVVTFSRMQVWNRGTTKSELLIIGGIFRKIGIVYKWLYGSLNKSSTNLKEVASRTTLEVVITTIVRNGYLNKFVQLGGFPLLNEGLEEADKGKLRESGISTEFNRAMDDIVLTSFHAL